MKYLIFISLMFCSLLVKSQISFTTPVGKDYKSLTLLINSLDQSKSLFFYNDLKVGPTLLTAKRDTSINRVTFGLFTSSTGLKFFISIPDDYRNVMLYDSKGVLIANLANDSYSFLLAHPNKTSANIPAIPPAVLSGLFKVFLMAI